LKRLQFAASATRDLRRLRDFIAEHDPAAAARVGKPLGRTIRLIRYQPAPDNASERPLRNGCLWV
jgi:plasmid stabilization system protein ParE